MFVIHFYDHYLQISSIVFTTINFFPCFVGDKSLTNDLKHAYYFSEILDWPIMHLFILGFISAKQKC